MRNEPASYTPEWFGWHAEGSRRSADRILPLVLEYFPVASALDVGCGVGAWLAALQTLGVQDVVGIDGDHVDREMLEIPSERFIPLDLEEPFDLDRDFDLVVSMEVAEHLPAAAADGFVDSLVRHAPVVLFSAAIPGQGGVDHVNEQWPDYWATKFRRRGFLAVDAIRPQIWTDPEIDFWYTQNTITYVRDAAIPQLLRPRVVEELGTLSVVHPRQFAHVCEPQPRPRRRRLLLEATIGAAATERLRRAVRGS